LVHVDNFIIGDNLLDGTLSFYSALIPKNEAEYILLYIKYYGEKIGA